VEMWSPVVVVVVVAAVFFGGDVPRREVLA